MSGPHQYSTDELLSYVSGELGQDERAPLERHVAGCADCQEFMAFVRTFNAGVRKAVSDPRAAGEPCPETFLIAALEANALDEITANHVRSHVLFCESCLEDFLSLRRITREQARESIPASWIETIERIGRTLIDLAKDYGVGTILGPALIVGEGPALAVRGAASTPEYSKSIEITVGRNTYCMEISLNEGGQLSIDFAGSAVREKGPATVILRADSGEELASTETDSFGNGELSIRAADAVSSTCVLCVAVGGSQEYLLLQVPPTKEPT